MQVKMSAKEKELFTQTAKAYDMSLADFARRTMLYFAQNRPTLTIEPDEPVQPDDPLNNGGANLVASESRGMTNTMLLSGLAAA